MTQPEMSRRTFLKKAAIKWSSLSILGFSGVYAFGIEPHWIDITHETISLSTLPKSFIGTRIVHISDLHLGFYMDTDDLIELVLQIQQLQPDLLCFTGDLVDHDPAISLAAIPYLKKLQAPLGKFAVLGNHDYQRNAAVVTQSLTKGGFQVLNNSHRILRKHTDQIAIIGVEDQLMGQPNLAKACEGLSKTCSILLSHCPDFAEEITSFPIGLQLSGHSHGGQVRLPFVGHLMTPTYAKKYVEGLYQMEENELQVYVNRGIGTTILPVRFFCRPQISVIELKKENP
jgi:predicted MPP superfamily phosphohydrolase